MISLFSGLLTGLFGRLGGMGGAWYKRSWVRDWLIGPVCCGTAWLLGIHDPWILATIFTTAAALSTYWDWLFGYDCYWFHGLVVGIAAFPIAIVTGHWEMFLARCILVSLWMGIWSWAIKDDDLEEFGRYLIVGSTIILIC